MEKRIKKITITLFAFCIILLFTVCKSLPAAPDIPVVSLSSAELMDITFNGMQLLCKVQIENPNSFEIPFPKINWRIFLNNNSFINGVIESNQRIKARETTIIEVPIHLEYLEIFKVFSSLKGRSQADYKVALALNFPIPVIQNRTWNLEHEGELPLLQAPRFSSPVMRVIKTDSTMVELYVSVNVDNPNVFELPTPRLNFDYQVNDTSILRHRLNSRGPLASSSVTPVVFGLIVYYADLFRILPTVRTSFEVQSLLDLTLDFPVPAFSGENFNLKIPGTLPLTGR
jgi:LEA14-like dessication related protein